MTHLHCHLICPSRPWEELGTAECQTPASLAQEGPDPTLGVLSQLPTFMTPCPPGLPVAAGKHPDPSAGNGRGLYQPLDHTIIKGLLERLGATSVHPRNPLSARGLIPRQVHLLPGLMGLTDNATSQSQ